MHKSKCIKLFTKTPYRFMQMCTSLFQHNLYQNGRYVYLIMDFIHVMPSKISMSIVHVEKNNLTGQPYGELRGFFSCYTDNDSLIYIYLVFCQLSLIFQYLLYFKRALKDKMLNSLKRHATV